MELKGSTLLTGTSAALRKIWASDSQPLLCNQLTGDGDHSEVSEIAHFYAQLRWERWDSRISAASDQITFLFLLDDFH